MGSTTLRRTRDLLLGTVRSCDTLGVDLLVVHAGAAGPQDRESALGAAAESFRLAVGEADRTRVLVELMAGTTGAVASVPSEAEELCTAVDDERLGICLDTAHLFAAGVPLDVADGVEGLAEELRARALDERLVLVHANDSVFERGARRDRHADIGDGRIGEQGWRAWRTIPSSDRFLDPRDARRCRSPTGGHRPPAAPRGSRLDSAPGGGVLVDDASDRLLRVIEEYERVAEAVTPDDAIRTFDETTLQLFWQRWPHVSSWGGALWRQLNDDLADPATPPGISRPMRSVARAAVERRPRRGHGHAEGDMTPDVFSTTPSTPVADVADSMLKGQFGSALVMEGSTLMGIFTERDVLRAAAARADLTSSRVIDWMTGIRSPRAPTWRPVKPPRS